MTQFLVHLIQNAVRVVSSAGSLEVFVADPGDDTPCKCCAEECASEMLVEVSFCGMTLSETIQIPGFLGDDGVPDRGIVVLPDGSFVILRAQIGCTLCGWVVAVEVCAFCVETDQFASDSFSAFVPFAQTPEADNEREFCPQTGPVELSCFSEQFGIPCVTQPAVTIA